MIALKGKSLQKMVCSKYTNCSFIYYFLFIIFYILILFLFISCVNESFNENDLNTEILNSDNLEILSLPGCFAVSLSPTGSFNSRAGNRSLDYGEEQEYSFAPREGDGPYHHFMLVYDDKGKNLGVFPMELSNEAGEVGKNGNTNQNVTLIVSSIISNKNFKDTEIETKESLINYLNGKKAYFLINVNNNDFLDIYHTGGLITYSEKDLKEAVINYYSIKLGEGENEEEYFTMSNSSYILDGEIRCATKLNLSENNVFQSIDEALTSSESACVAYVERLAVKYTVKFNLQPIEIPVKKFQGIEYSNTGYTIRNKEEKAVISICGAGITGIERSSYILKKINDYSYLDNSNGNLDWNDHSKFRSYWAEDPNYEINSATLLSYPHQFRQALETDTIRSLHEGSQSGYIDYVWTEENKIMGKIDVTKTNSEICLKYNPLEKIITKNNDDLNNLTFYSLENTYYDPGMTSNKWGWCWNKTPYSVGTNLIVAAKVKLEDSVEDTTLYSDQADIWYISEADLIDSKIKNLNHYIYNNGSTGINLLKGEWDKHIKGQDVNQIKWKSGSVLWVVSKDNTGKTKERELITEDFKLIDAEISGGDGQMLIAPKLYGDDAVYYIAPYSMSLNENDNKIKYRDEDSSEEITYNQLVSLIHLINGPINVYKNGYMYYNIPISHNSESFRDNDENGLLASWKTPGAVGVVRNNWYNISVNDITKIGTPVVDITQPIVPVMDVRRSYINVSVRVIDWHSVTHHDVPVGPLQ